MRRLSIRSRIFLGCSGLTCATILIGVLSQNVQLQLSRAALEIYDGAFQSMNYLRSAQSTILGMSRDLAAGETTNAILIDQLQSVLDALDIARERHMSPEGERLTVQLQSIVSGLQATIRTSNQPVARRDFLHAEKVIDMAVSVYAKDGFRLRQSAEDLVWKAQVQTSLAVLGSAITAMLLAWILSRAIVPPIRRAVAIATEIAAGNLDNRIEAHGSSETGILLTALATMQTNISDKIAFIEALMARQVSSHGIEIAAQNVRFEAALDHMTLGLRMFDARNALVVQNRRFSEMFGTRAVGDSGEADGLGSLSTGGPPARAGTHHRVLDDGRTIAISEEPMADGGRVVTYEDVTERQRIEEHLFHMARHDALTGLPNRILLREHLQHLLREADRAGVTSVLYLDLDRFKTVNDTLGHPAGDELLRQAAGRLLGTIDDRDLVVRLGGDEFAIVQRRTARSNDATTLAATVIDLLGRPFDVEGHRIAVGVSVGIAEAFDGTTTSDELLKNADMALYSAKAGGRGTYRVFEPDMNARIQARRALELDLRTAIHEEELEVYYQPIVAARTGAVVAFEALLRWNHPDRGLVSPTDFVPLAEETGLISTIGFWVLNRACLDAATWPKHVKVAVNLSPVQFRDRDLVADVDEVLARSGLCPMRLDLEITESLMLENWDHVAAVLHDLRARGIGISMDDFGTGYSSLSYLRRFPFDKIKIDRTFTRDVVESKEGLAIVQAVTRLGQALRMTVVAEGVETEEQRQLLREAGCEKLQGYLFGRPQPLSSVKGLIGQLPISWAA